MNTKKLYDISLKEIVEKANTNDSFIQFVTSIDNPGLKFFLENRYQEFKKDKYFDYVHLGENGCIEFSATLLLDVYSRIKRNNKVVEACFQALIMAYQGASPLIFSDVMDDIIKNETNIPYSEWSAVYRYLRDEFAVHIRGLEFAADYTAHDHLRYSEFIKSI